MWLGGGGVCEQGNCQDCICAMVHTQWPQEKEKTAMAYRDALLLLNVSYKCHAGKEMSHCVMCSSKAVIFPSFSYLLSFNFSFSTVPHQRKKH